MNDIEIFKKLKKNYNTLKKDYNAGHYSVYEMQFEDFEAIENLIQRNKDLEQIEQEHKEENGRLREELGKIEYIKRSFDYCLEQKTKELEKQFNTTEIEQGTEGQKRIKAIESLIQRNKELEMQNKEFLIRLKADGLIERDKYWINKIKENIKMLDKEEKKSLKGTKGQDRYSIKLEYMHKRNALQELLEESEK